jgi:hypothetical protein
VASVLACSIDHVYNLWEEGRIKGRLTGPRRSSLRFSLEDWRGFIVVRIVSNPRLAVVKKAKRGGKAAS